MQDRQSVSGILPFGVLLRGEVAGNLGRIASGATAISQIRLDHDARSKIMKARQGFRPLVYS
jgi:hypothetical protein